MEIMAAGDRSKSGKPIDIVRHFSDSEEKYSIPICGNKKAGYVTDDKEDVTCLKCLKKLNP